MIFIVIFLSAIFINILIIYILVYRKNIFKVPFWILIISIILIISGITFILWQQTEIENELAKRDWSIIIGEIMDSQIVGDRALRAEIKYNYQITDSIYTGISDYNIPGFGGKNYRRKNARIVKNKYPVGMKIKVYYNPTIPKISTLRYGPYWSNYMILAFGSTLLLIGVFLIELYIITLIKTKEK